MISVPSNNEVDRLHAYWRASNYLCAGMLYLRDNVLLRRPLEPAHIKPRILGHWGTCPGLSFTLTHLNRLIREHDLDLMFVCGPGHGAAAVLAHAYLDGHYSERYPECSQDEAGMTHLFRHFRRRTASVRTARHNCPARSTRAVSWATACRTRLGRPSTIPT